MLSGGGIHGVVLRSLSPIGDERGVLCETHRDTWYGNPRPQQWDFVTTNAHFLRGLHVHRLRFDYLTIVQGRAAVGLADLRRNSTTFRKTMLIDVDGNSPQEILIPPGVVHGIMAITAVSYLYGLTSYWDGNDQLGCRYDDPSLNLPWPGTAPQLNRHDLNLPDFETLIQQFEAAGGVGAGLQTMGI